MIVRLLLIVSFLFMMLVAIESRAAVVESYGESAIERNDISTAKSIAISRAKWSAISSVSKVKVKVDTLLVNSKLADEAVKTELSASLADFKIMDEGRDLNTYWVRLKVKVDELDAQKELSIFSKDTAIAVILPAVRLDERYDMEHAFSLKVMNDLKEKGFEVRDVLGENSLEYREVINKAIATDSYDTLNFIANKYLSSTMLIGKLRASERGTNAGYADIKFKIVDGELDWKLVGTRDGGRRVLLKSGTYKGRGQGSSAQAAVNNLYENMARSVAPKLVSDVAEEVLGVNYRSVMIVLAGQSNIKNLYALKKDLQTVPFVLDAKEQGMDTVIVNYPEKSYYLAAFLTQGGKYRLLKMGKNEIVLERM